MFNFFKKIFSFKHLYENDMEAYHQYIVDLAKNSKNELIGNFSYKGFNWIYEELLANTKYELIFFIRNYESIFDEIKMLMLENLVLKKFEAHGGKVLICTFNGEVCKKFIEMEESYKCLKYINITIDDSLSNNFILSDGQRYWLEESWTTMNRLDMDQKPIKACVNFKDYKECAKLMKTINIVLFN